MAKARDRLGGVKTTVTIDGGSLSERRDVAYTIADVVLDVKDHSDLDVDLIDRLTGATLDLTMAGASTLSFVVEDPDLRILRGKSLTGWAWGKKGYSLADKSEKGWVRKGNVVDIAMSYLDFRLVKVNKEPPTTLTLTLEDRIVAYLRHHKGAKSVSRNKTTRAGFVQMLCQEVHQKRSGFVPFFIPAQHRKVPIQTQSERLKADERSDTGASGIHPKSDLTVKGKAATASQLDIAQRILDVAHSHKASERATLSMLVAAIGESSMSVVPNSAGSGYAGVFQADPANIPMSDTEKQARYFLIGGLGFQAGGAIALCREHPDYTPGHVAYLVEGDRSNFTSDAAAAHFYDQHSEEAHAFLNAYQGGGVGSGSDGSKPGASYAKSYQFARGKHETSWDAMQRLADEVNWRAFVRQGRLWFISEADLFSQAPEMVLEEGEKGVDTIGFDIDMGAHNLISEIDVAARSNLWTALPGMVVLVKGQGPADGRWLVDSITLDLLDPSGQTDIKLRKPLPEKKEPAHEVAQRSGGGVAQRSGDGPLNDGSGSKATGDVKVDTANGSFATQTTRPDGKRVLPNKGIREFLAALAGASGHTVYTNTYSRHSRLSSSGLVSDHWDGNAADLNTTNHGGNWPNGYGTDMVYEAARLCGLSQADARARAHGSGTFAPMTWKHGGRTYRVQVLWGPTVAHTDHVHVGVHPLYLGPH